MESEKISNPLYKESSSKYGSVKNNFVNPLNFKIHTVENNETLISIAVKYDVSVDELRKLNGLWNDSIICKRQIRVPQPVSSQAVDYADLEDFLTSSNSSDPVYPLSIPTSTTKSRQPTLKTTGTKSLEIGDYFAKFDRQLLDIKSSLKTSSSRPDPY